LFSLYYSIFPTVNVPIEFLEALSLVVSVFYFVSSFFDEREWEEMPYVGEVPFCLMEYSFQTALIIFFLVNRNIFWRRVYEYFKMKVLMPKARVDLFYILIIETHGFLVGKSMKLWWSN
jgi:hypothetical protein